MDNMPLSPDAFQSTSDGSEFYFIVLEENARALQFASYYGGQANEHVDAGTSRFSPDGTIYQAVCAGCGNQTFPTTPGVYGPNNNSSNCNLGVIKIDFESIINAATTIDLTFVGDTVCDTLVMRFNNNSFNANQYLWDFGNGRTSDEIEPIARFDTLGTYKITLIAIDTL
jgi:PKD repeat protein